MNAHPLAYATQIKVKVGNRRAATTATIIDHYQEDGQYIYRCLFPYQRGYATGSWWGNVPADDIEEIGEVDEQQAAKLMAVEPYR